MPHPRGRGRAAPFGNSAGCLMTEFLRQSLLMLGAACVLLTLTACNQAPPADRLIEGRLFPPLLLHEFAGESRAIESYRGRLVILNVWATWCPPCRKELPSLERLHQRLDTERFAVIGMSIDTDPDIAQEFLLDRGITFRNYFDREGDAAVNLLGIRVYPDTFILSPEGVLLRKIVGEREWDDPRLVEALEAAFAGDPRGLRDL